MFILFRSHTTKKQNGNGHAGCRCQTVHNAEKIADSTENDRIDKNVQNED